MTSSSQVSSLHVKKSKESGIRMRKRFKSHAPLAQTLKDKTLTTRILVKCFSSPNELPVFPFTRCFNMQFSSEIRATFVCFSDEIDL